MPAEVVYRECTHGSMRSILLRGIPFRKIFVRRIARYIFPVLVLLASCKVPTSSKVWVVSTLAGSGASGYLDAIGIRAQFDKPYGVAVDQIGNVYVADYNNHCIRKITAGGRVNTFAGNGSAGYLNATGTKAQFSYPTGVAVDSFGNVYVADDRNHCIRKITKKKEVSTFAGSTVMGFKNGVGGEARFKHPIDVAVDRFDNVYVVDYGNHSIRKITQARMVSTLISNAGDSADSETKFSLPTGVATDRFGNVYVVDYGNHSIRKITISDSTKANEVSTIAGSGTAGSANGVGTAAQFNDPNDVAVDRFDNVYVADYSNHRIRKITAERRVSTIAGSDRAGYLDGTGISAQFYSPIGVAVDLEGNVYVSDFVNHRIRKLEYKTP